MHLDVESFRFNLFSALSDSITSIHERFRHNPSFIIPCLFLDVDKSSLSRVFLKELNDNLLTFGSIYVADSLISRIPIISL
jgi:hypothetical protein